MKHVLTLVLLLPAAFLNAQQIQSLYISPVNPSTTDFIRLYADVSFPSGACSDKSQNFTISGTTIYGYAIHCIGPLTYICDHTDTFDVGMLPAGNYVFNFSVDYGMLPSPCTPGIVPGPSDTFSFTVSPSTDIEEAIPGAPEITLNGNLLEIKMDQPFAAYIYDAAGRIEGEYPEMNLGVIRHMLNKEGIYMVSVVSEKTTVTRKVFASGRR